MKNELFSKKINSKKRNSKKRNSKKRNSKKRNSKKRISKKMKGGANVNFHQKSDKRIGIYYTRDTGSRMLVTHELTRNSNLDYLKREIMEKAAANEPLSVPDSFDIYEYCLPGESHESELMDCLKIQSADELKNGERYVILPKVIDIPEVISINALLELKEKPTITLKHNKEEKYNTILSAFNLEEGARIQIINKETGVVVDVDDLEPGGNYIIRVEA